MCPLRTAARNPSLDDRIPARLPPCFPQSRWGLGVLQSTDRLPPPQLRMPREQSGSAAALKSRSQFGHSKAPKGRQSARDVDHALRHCHSGVRGSERRKEGHNDDVTVMSKSIKYLLVADHLQRQPPVTLPRQGVVIPCLGPQRRAALRVEQDACEVIIKAGVLVRNPPRLHDHSELMLILHMMARDPVENVVLVGDL